MASLSRRSQVSLVVPLAQPASDFHKAECKAAAKILEKYLVHKNTRDEAIQADKNPAHDCNP